jgi:hypothetical protein
VVAELYRPQFSRTRTCSDPVNLQAKVLRNMFALNNRGLLDGKLTGRALTNTVCLAASSGFFLLGYDRECLFQFTKDLH